MFKKFYLIITLFVFISVLFGCQTTPHPQIQTQQTVHEEKNIQKLILEGRTEEAKNLFQAKIDINEIDENGNTVLHTASKINDADLVTFFIYKGANVELKNNAGDTPLHVAIKNNSKECTAVLAAIGTNIFARDAKGLSALELGLEKGYDYYDALLTTKTGLARDTNGKNLIHYLVEAENENALAYCLKKDIPISYLDKNGNSPLTLAYAKNSLKGINIASNLILADAIPERKEYSYFEDSVKTRNPSLRFDDGQTPLHFSAIYGHDAITEFLLQNGASVKAKDVLGSTPLHEAVRYGHKNIVQLLLDNGADPNSQDSLGKTPLLLVIPKQYRIEISSMLITHGANPNAKDMYGDTPVHIATMSSMDVQMLENLKNGGADINERNKQGITPMSLAVDRLNKEHIKFYTEKGAEIHAEDIKGNTPLSRILEAEDKTTSSELLKIIVNSKNINSRDSFGNTPLHIAVNKNASPEQFKYLLSLTDDVDIRNRNGDTPLYLAVQKNRRIHGEMLLAKQADVFSTNNENYSPLRMALVGGGEAQEWILTSDVIKKTDGTGNTPLHYAAEWKLDNAVSILLEKGANPNSRNTNGETAIFNAIKSDSTSTIDLLIRKGAQKNARDYLGNTPLHACVRWDSKNSAMKLIQWKSDLDVQNLAGKTPLSQAARSGRIAMVTLLTENGANIDATDATGKTVLIDAIQSRNVDIVSYLVKNNASPHIQEMYGRNAFHEAASTGNEKIISIIQQTGANPLSRDTHGITPLAIALQGQDKKLIKAVLGKNPKLLDSDSNNPIHIALNNNVTVEVLDLLIEMNYPVNTRNKDGVTPLAIAVKKNLNEHSILLLENGANPFISDNEKNCPLTIAFENLKNSKDYSIIDNIVKLAGNKTDYQGEGILHYAARIADAKTVQLLVEKGLDKTVRNISGETPEDIAIRWKRKDIADLLK